MAYRIHHVKAADPRRTADGYVRVFRFRVVSDDVRVYADRVVRCQSEDGTAVTIPGARARERLGPGDANAHHGPEHFRFDSGDLAADITRLGALGAPRLEGPLQVPNGHRIAFLQAPDGVRIELIPWPACPAVAGGGC